MIWGSRALDLALLGTGLWLLAVLAVQIGFKASLLTGAALLLLLVFLALRRLVPAERWTAVAAMAAVALLAPMVMAHTQPQAVTAAGEKAWRTFDETEIARLVGERSEERRKGKECRSR